MTDNTIDHKNDRQYNRPQEWQTMSIVLSVILVVYCIVCYSCGLLYCLSFLWSIVLSVIVVVYCIVCHCSRMTDSTIDHKNDRQYNRPLEWQTIQYTTRMTDNAIDHKNDRQYNTFLWSVVFSVILVVYCIVCHSCGLFYCLSFLWSIVLSVILVAYCIFCHSCGLLCFLSFLWSIALSVILVVYCIFCH
jgi:4-hydroxybenzoate polyprenyltransferase